ncbi:glycine-rich domain-containing protein [Thermomonospora amylolytica]|uniref:glycine-rich domain-containing protein n=1 Tax=Thermomonospora amylolytica TaxID=1411117 RepID=UPI000E6C9020|nr:hypothetical protein [Thermomonospora amylolytica]
MTVTPERTATAVASDPRHLVSPDLFGRLVDRIARDEQVSTEHAERVMTQTLAFLQACALTPGAGLSPSRAVDVGWHTFVLHTREYAEFCDRIAGRFIHHTPTGDSATDGPVTAVGATVAAMRAAGLPVDIELWVSSADCSQCHAGCYDSPNFPEGA